MNLASFDVFDTVLIRKCGKPENVFAIMAKKLFPDNLSVQDEFINWRIRRTEDVSAYNPNYKLSDIYKELPYGAFGGKKFDELIEAELHAEQNELTRNDCAVKTVNEYRAEGWQIAFITDMYHSKEFIKSILDSEGVMFDGDILYVSSDVGCRKDNGMLYDYVREQLHPDKWIHFGDNEYSDVKMAGAKGIKAKRLFSPFSDIESKTIAFSHCFRHSYDLSILSGLERTARVKFNNSGKAMMAANFIGAAYIPYVMHVLSDARERGLKRLYFLSRDSYILMKIAEVLPHYGIELRYLFVSRKSLIKPFLYKTDRKQLKNFLSLNSVNIDSLFESISLSRKILKEKGYIFLFDYLDVNDDNGIEKVIDALFDPQIYVMWQAEAKKCYEECVGYLRQEGVLDDINFALVDIGWLGTTRLMINAIRTRENPMSEKCFSYYWGTVDNVISSCYGPFDTFLFNLYADVPLTLLIENYYSVCPYPTTIGYKAENGVFEPLFKNADTKALAELAACNVSVVKCLAALIAEYKIDTSCLYFWAFRSTVGIRNNTCKIDYSPFVDIKMDDKPIVKHLSWSEIAKIFFMEKEITHFDGVSLEYTLGRNTGNAIWRQTTAFRNIKKKAKSILKRNRMLRKINKRLKDKKYK